jgi:hypothetical protein
MRMQLPIGPIDQVVLRQTVFQKTQEGHEEVRRRGSKDLPPRARALLVIIDGKTSGEVLLEQLTGLGVRAETFHVLLSRQLIETAEVAGPGEPSESGGDAPEKIEEYVPDLIDRKRELHAFLAQTISDLLGVRGCFLQLAAQKADSLDDFRALRDRCVAAVTRARGSEVAEAMCACINEMLG